MILGVGLDVVETQRIARALALHGGRFEERVYTAAELATCADRPTGPKRWPDGLPPRRRCSKRWARARRAASRFNRSKWSAQTAAAPP